MSEGFIQYPSGEIIETFQNFRLNDYVNRFGQKKEEADSLQSNETLFQIVQMRRKEEKYEVKTFYKVEKVDNHYFKEQFVLNLFEQWCQNKLSNK